MKPQQFSRMERLRLKRDVDKLLAEGQRASRPPFLLVWRGRGSVPGLPDLRFAVKLRRGFENAVCRNRVKRLLREVYRREKERVTGGVDLLIVVQPFQVDKSWDFFKTRDLFILLCKEAGLWKPS